jgi:hypothetical protein
MRFVHIVVLLAVSLIWAPVAHAAEGGERTIGLSASKFEFEAQAGQVGEGTVWVSNDGDTPVSVRVYAADQVIDEKGTATYVVPSLDTNMLQSPASWVTVSLPEDAKSLGNIPYVDMEPGERLQVDFDVEIPDSAVPGDHQSVLFFEMFDPNAATAPGSTRVDARLGARIRTRVSGEIIEDVDVAPFRMPSYVIGSSVPYQFTVVNKGNVDQSVSARLAQLDSSDAEVAAEELMADTALFANSQLQKSGSFEVASPAIGPTRFNLALSYPSQTPGANGLVKSVEKTRVVWVVPPWLPIALGALLLLFLAAAIWAAGRRSAQRQTRRAQVESAGPVTVDDGDER